MTYRGYSIVGDHNDYLARAIKKNAQKTELKKHIAADIELKKAFFKAYLHQGYELGSLSLEQQALAKNIMNHFDGKAKTALVDRFDANIREAFFLNHQFVSFLKQF